ncbi:50S ribosomal protein L9 [Scrofimicrobium sp. R131]|uniref:Large ribosomal subunit protein bL9 n=1 Tax=Scrofimicrobium appendicitidis TaxID=3079930 RepID=A0AAU7V6X1_9ACTO
MATRKVVLNRDVEKLGSAGEVVEVRDGYARNYLIPRGYAVKWTKGAQRHIDQIVESRRRHEIASVEDAIAIREQIGGLDQVSVTRKAGSNGRLFGAVSPKHVAEALSAALGRVIDHRKVELPQVIKSTGTYPVVIKLHPDVVAESSVTVVAE